MGPMTEEEYKEYERKCRARGAVDTILAAEQHKKDPELKKHIKAEMKERAKHLESAMGSKKKEPKKEASKKAAPAKKSAGKKK
jgi:hypothetical protein